MNSATKVNRPAILAGAAAPLAIAAMGFAGAAQARDNVYWSVGIGTPGAVVNVGNSRYAGPIYQAPVYVQPQPVYVAPAPVYYQPRPVYVQPAPVYYAPQPTYYAPQPVYVERPRYRHYRHDRQYREGYYQQGPQGYGQGYSSVYYNRDGRGDYRHDDRH